ncbi:MAG: lipid-A-disaccharide synthase [Deltaproteobacteria bacterium]|nr:lipid-A-disaccharide synthase [Deltaproteobacteria bacterium]
MISEKTKHVLIVAGEASADLHGSNLVTAIKKILPDIKIQGIGGDRMKDAGVDILISSSEMAVVGLTEVFSRLTSILKAQSLLKKILKIEKPDLLILIDYPDFNINLARFAKRFKVPVLYYISPQVWAWRKGRIKKIARRVDRMAVILPFEKDLYTKTGLQIDYVGHPLLDTIPGSLFNKGNQADIPAESAYPLIGLLPGSRENEIKRLLPLLIKTVEILLARYKNLRCVIPVAPTISDDLIRSYTKNAAMDIRLSHENVYQSLKTCDAALVASGTATLEVAAMNIPMVIVYQVSPISYWVARMAVNVPFIGLVNLIAGEEVIPEYIQNNAKPKNIANELVSIIEDPARRSEMKMNLRKVINMLGEGGASEKTAGIAIEMMLCH